MKKLLNNRGSALFMVLSIMTVLIIAATAVYFVMWSNQTTAQTHYEGEQAYQTAHSVSNAVSDYIDSYLTGLSTSELPVLHTKLADSPNKLVTQMIKMGEGASISTQNGSLDTLISLNDYGMGEYSVTITKKDYLSTDEETRHTFEIRTTAEVNGETAEIVEYKYISTGPVEYFSRLFTSTGKSDKDAFLGAQSVLTPLYFENDFSSFSGKIKSDLISSGSLSLNYSSGMETIFEESSDIYVANNLFVGSSSNKLLERGGNVYVGGDFIGKGHDIGADKMYIVGDMNWSNSANGTSGTEEIFVNGDLVLDNVSQIQNCTIYVNGDVTVKNSFGSGAGNLTIKYKGNLSTENIDQKYTNAESGNCIFVPDAAPWDPQEVSAEIAAETARNNYAKWDAEDACKNSTGFIAQSHTLTEINGLSAKLYSSNAGNSRVVINTQSGETTYVYLQPDGNGNFQFTGEDSQVLINGSGSVVFVLPENANFVQPSKSYVGHVGWLSQVNSNYTIEFFNSYNEIDGQKRLVNTPSIQLNESTANTLKGVINEETGLIKEPYLGSIHNNVFLVSAGEENIIDFSGSMSAFMGFVYARDSIFQMTQDAKFGIGGGVIAGSYDFGNANTSTALYLLPYDYTKGYPDASTDVQKKSSEYMRELMGSNAQQDGNSKENELKAYGTITYK